MLTDLLNSPLFKKHFFEQEHLLKKDVEDQSMLAIGITEDRISNLLSEGKLSFEESQRANSTIPFIRNRSGFDISMNYGSRSGDFSSVLFFDSSNLKKSLGHSEYYINSIQDETEKAHKIQENPVVVRVQGDLGIDRVKYLLIRDKDGKYFRFGQGIETLPNLSISNPGKNLLVFGERFGFLDDIEMESNIISRYTPDIIYSQALEAGDEISSMRSSNIFRNKSKSEEIFSTPEFSSSKTYLSDFYDRFQIPIIGFSPESLPNMGDFEKSLLLIGRDHKENVFKKYGPDLITYSENSNN